MTLEEIKCQLSKEQIKEKKSVDTNQLFLLCGLPYSGKSTLAEKIAQRNFAHVWATKVKKQYMLNDEQMLSVAEGLCRDLLNKHYNIAFDFLNHTKAHRNRFQRIARELHVPCTTIYLKPPIEEIRRRQSHQMENPPSLGRSNISMDVVHHIASEFESPLSDENVFVVENQDAEMKLLSKLPNDYFQVR